MVRSSFYFVGQYHAASVEIYSYLKEHSLPIEKISHSSEIDQSDPYQKCVIIFSAAKEAIAFLSEGRLPKKSFCALIMQREGVFKPEALKTFETLNLKFYTPKNIQKLIGDVDQFLLGHILKTEDLEFSVQLALGKD